MDIHRIKGELSSAVEDRTITGFESWTAADYKELMAVVVGYVADEMLPFTTTDSVFQTDLWYIPVKGNNRPHVKKIFASYLALAALSVDHPDIYTEVHMPSLKFQQKGRN